MENLCMAGGVALNSVANYRILEDSGFKNIYIQPAAGDSGGALGAALYVTTFSLQERGHPERLKGVEGSLNSFEVISHTREIPLPRQARDRNDNIQKGFKRFPMYTAYLGSEYSDVDIKTYLIEHMIPFRILPTDQLLDYIATRIKEGKVVGWMQGRFEWGPRALGARSILADARNPKMKDIINAKVKFREAFRPFAPSVLAEQAHRVFDFSFRGSSIINHQSLIMHFPLRFMQYVVPVKKEWRKKIPAVTHKDGTARPQLVYRKDNPLYYDLIDAFYKKTEVPLVLNTSFNLKGEPIVASPADAYSTFSRSGIDLLVMGNCICEKVPSA